MGNKTASLQIPWFSVCSIRLLFYTTGATTTKDSDKLHLSAECDETVKPTHCGVSYFMWTHAEGQTSDRQVADRACVAAPSGSREEDKTNQVCLKRSVHITYTISWLIQWAAPCHSDVTSSYGVTDLSCDKGREFIEPTWRLNLHIFVFVFLRCYVIFWGKSP